MTWITNGGITQDVPEFRADLLCSKDGSWKRVGEPSAHDEPVDESVVDAPVDIAQTPTNAEIRADAEAAGIDLGDAKTKADMLAAIDAHYTE